MAREVLIRKTVYTFAELDPQVQQKLIERFQNVRTQHDGWWDPIYEGVKKELEKLGFEGVDIQFSGFGSQGDGASFTAERIDFEKFVAYYKPKLNSHFALNLETLVPLAKEKGISSKVVRTSHQHVHENTVIVQLDVEEELSEQEKILVDEVEDFLKNVVVAKSVAAYQKLEKYFFELISDESVKQWIIEQENEYEEDGDIYCDTHLEEESEEPDKEE